jgi:hypothetical protein
MLQHHMPSWMQKHGKAFEGINPCARNIKKGRYKQRKGILFAGTQVQYDVICDLRTLSPSRSKGSVAVNCKLSSCA